MKRNYFLPLVITFTMIYGTTFAGTKVYSPNIEKGELELEWRGNYDLDKRDDKDHNQQHKYAVGYGFTDYFASEVYLIATNPSHENYQAQTIEWENRFQLTDQGKNFADVGLYLAFEKALNSQKNHYAVEAKILLEKQIGKFVNRANIGIERELRQVNGEKAEKGIDLEIAWMTKYNWKKSFEPGFEYHVDLGNQSQDQSYSTQKHQVGPSIYGKIGNIKYDFGLLFGISKAALDQQIKWNMEYEF